MAAASRRALPHRRQLARLPGVLRAAGVDRDVDRLPDQRDLRVRLDAREDPHRPRRRSRRSSCGTRARRGRKEVYAEYKAPRPRAPDLLGEQWPHFEPLVEAFGYRNVTVEGFEADDVIASIAEQRGGRASRSTIVTGDRDAFQLIDPDGVRQVMATGRGITETKLYDRQAVVDRYGIPPELIPDFYGLKGDTSDNIPGVPGIGDKTAADLLQRFGDLESVLATSTRSRAPSARRT